MERAVAEKAFDLLDELAQAWEDRDCATVDRLTAWAENALGGRACEATRNGRPALTGYSDLEYLLPEAPGWFAVLARRPEPTYFLFVHDRNWRLAAGPLRLLGEAPERADGAGPSSGTARRARLVPQRHLTYLTDPAGVSGVAFPSGDAIADLRDELADRTARARPDRVSVDVELFGGPSRALALSNGSMLVFHTLRLVSRHRPGQGRDSLGRPPYGRALVKEFTGENDPASLTGTELVVLASEISAKNKLTTVALRRALADLTT
ncbi:hypothetical protein [Nonomuraea roseola]|uniref:Uncharacterized protein n=1 Tax=Nonomuraea roseola TaxID=46179 RepID=A0ABV5PQM2_9ACTN